ncbi:hypothetical protein WICMUC_004408 [Wickerhamomyces mucosus]|uniref:Mitochondrial carrier protein n=1 Tax=Wickerhamomyces mucosus TaxID=1378264 RepID=A0A9P8PJ07_9ASCO|nr:hypothetical protein WICMUC_004408 [Wickerhamomyces mucosus]
MIEESPKSTSHTNRYIHENKKLNRDLKLEPNLLTATIAGVSASIVQTSLTYPFEYIKTVQQLHRKVPDFSGRLPQNVDILGSQFKSIFAGSFALNVGNALKSSSRFIVFNYASKFMSTENGKTSAPRLVIAGAMTGFIEALWIIPFENIKTLMIENSVRVNQKLQEQELPKEPPIKKTFHKATNAFENHPFVKAKKYYDLHPAVTSLDAIKEIYTTKGFRGFFQGLSPTLIRQVSNSAVRFGTYTSLRQLFVPNGSEVNTYLSFTLGIISSVMVVAVTQPIDIVKTRMQSRETPYLYKNSLNCAYRIFVEEGVRVFWNGWFPRLLKVSTSGGIAFAVYQNVENQMTKTLKENPFKAE